MAAVTGANARMAASSEQTDRHALVQIQTARPSVELIEPVPGAMVRVESSAGVRPAELSQVLSPTQVRTFLDCSARWWFKYGLELPEQKTSSLALGLAVHRALEVNFREKHETGEDLHPTGVIAVFRDFWQDLLKDTFFQIDEDPAEVGQVGEQLVAKYMDEAAPLIQPAAMELEVAGEIAGVKVSGRIDVVDTTGRIIDVKTAARRPTAVPPDYAFQLATYRRLFPRASGEARLDTLVKTKAVQLVSIDYTVGSQDLCATEQLYPLVQDGIRSGLYFPNRQSFLCSRRHCPFWQRCERDFGGTVKDS